MAEKEQKSDLTKTESIGAELSREENCTSPRGVARGLSRSAEVLSALDDPMLQLPERLRSNIEAMEAKLTEGFSWSGERLAELRARLLGYSEQPSEDLQDGFRELMMGSRGSNLNEQGRELIGLLTVPTSSGAEPTYRTVAEIQAHLVAQNPVHADDELHATRRLVTVLTQLGTSYA